MQSSVATHAKNQKIVTGFPYPGAVGGVGLGPGRLDLLFPSKGERFAWSFHPLPFAEAERNDAAAPTKSIQ